jgi:hypothetical protein
MPQRFDPNIPPLIGGDITTVRVIDPATDFPPFEVGNLVLSPAQAFQVQVEWKIVGGLRPLWLKALGGKWNVQVFAESVGDGPEKLLARNDDVEARFDVFDYAVTLDVPAFSLPEGDPGSNVSGIYKIVAAVFLNSDLPAPGFDMIGFNEGPYIQIEDKN